MAEYTKAQLTEMIIGKLQRNFGRTVEDVAMLFSAICGRDFWTEGRTAEKLGLSGKTAAEIQEMVR